MVAHVFDPSTREAAAGVSLCQISEDGYSYMSLYLFSLLVYMSVLFHYHVFIT